MESHLSVQRFGAVLAYHHERFQRWWYHDNGCVMPRITDPYEVKVKSEIDVVTLRQQVRQVARLLGLGLTQQARITAAISAVARALVESSCHALFTIQANHRQPRPSLEITCILSCVVYGAKNGVDQLKSLLHFGEAQSLVDEADLYMQNDEAFLTLRIWIAS